MKTNPTTPSSKDSAGSIGAHFATGLASWIIGIIVGLIISLQSSLPTFIVPGEDIPEQNLQVLSTERRCFGWDTVDNERAWICDDGIAVCDDTRVKLPTHLNTPQPTGDPDERSSAQ